MILHDKNTEYFILFYKIRRKVDALFPSADSLPSIIGVFFDLAKQTLPNLRIRFRQFLKNVLK